MNPWIEKTAFPVAVEAQAGHHNLFPIWGLQIILREIDAITKMPDGGENIPIFVLGQLIRAW